MYPCRPTWLQSGHDCYTYCYETDLGFKIRATQDGVAFLEIVRLPAFVFLTITHYDLAYDSTTTIRICSLLLSLHRPDHYRRHCSNTPRSARGHARISFEHIRRKIAS